MGNSGVSSPALTSLMEAARSMACSVSQSAALHRCGRWADLIATPASAHSPCIIRRANISIRPGGGCLGLVPPISRCFAPWRIETFVDVHFSSGPGDKHIMHPGHLAEAEQAVQVINEAL